MTAWEIVMTQMTYSGSKKIAIISNGKPQSKRVAQKIFSALKEDSRFYLTKKNPDIVISIGGDGMFLSAFHMYEKELSRVRFVGLHTGHLGFYADYLDSQVDELLKNLRSDKGEKISYPILKVTVNLADGRQITGLALNEVTIKRIEKTMVADVIVNNVKLERFRGDGLLVATPTGSTGYNKSLGGAILHPTIEALQLTEIASLSNRVYRTIGSSMIVPKKDRIDIIPKRTGRYVISVDNKTYTYRDVKKISYQIDQQKIHFMGTPWHTSFWQRTKDAFLGDINHDL